MQIYIKWVIIGIVTISVAVLLLNIIGQSFIREVVQEVSIHEEDKGITGVHIGKLAPHWVLPDIKEQDIALSDFFGTPIIMTFWASWNASSADQIRILDVYQDRYGEAVPVIIAINNQEDRSIVTNFIQRGAYEVPVVLDELGVVGELYGIETLPVTYFLNKEGIVQERVTGTINEKILTEKIEKLLK